MPTLIPLETPEPLVFTIDPEKRNELTPPECVWNWSDDEDAWFKKQRGLYIREAKILRIDTEIRWRREVNDALKEVDRSHPWNPATPIDLLGFRKDHGGKDRQYNFPIVATATAIKIVIPGVATTEGYLGLGRGGAKVYRGFRLFEWNDGYHGPLCHVLGVRAVPPSP